MMLRKAFPDRKGHYHLWKRWQICEEIRPHVASMQSHYQVLRANRTLKQDENFTGLLCDMAWSVYLLYLSVIAHVFTTLNVRQVSTRDSSFH